MFNHETLKLCFIFPGSIFKCCFYFWNYNRIMSFCPSLSSLQTLQYILPCSLSNSWHLFKLIGGGGCRVCMWGVLGLHVCLCIVHSTYFSYICFLGRPIGVLFPGKDYFSLSWHSLVTCSSLCRVEAFRGQRETLPYLP